MIVSIDRGSCTGCGLCTTLCPSIFAMDETLIAVVRTQPKPEEEPDVRDAAEACPVSAIRIQEDKSG